MKVSIYILVCLWELKFLQSISDFFHSICSDNTLKCQLPDASDGFSNSEAIPNDNLPSDSLALPSLYLNTAEQIPYIPGYCTKYKQMAYTLTIFFTHVTPAAQNCSLL